MGIYTTDTYENIHVVRYLDESTPEYQEMVTRHRQRLCWHQWDTHNRVCTLCGRSYKEVYNRFVGKD